MKGKNEAAQPHAVPLTDDLRAIFDGLPQFRGPSAGPRLARPWTAAAAATAP